MKYLKLFENKSDQDYITDFLVDIGMFIDSIKKTWNSPDNYEWKMGSTNIKMYIKGEFFHGRDVFVLELNYEDSDFLYPPIHFNADNDLFGGEEGEPPDCVRYIDMKIFQELGDITTDNLEKLSKLKFNKNEIDTYIETEKYNL